MLWEGDDNQAFRHDIGHLVLRYRDFQISYHTTAEKPPTGRRRHFREMGPMLLLATVS